MITMCTTVVCCFIFRCLFFFFDFQHNSCWSSSPLLIVLYLVVFGVYFLVVLLLFVPVSFVTRDNTYFKYVKATHVYLRKKCFDSSIDFFLTPNLPVMIELAFLPVYTSFLTMFNVCVVIFEYCNEYWIITISLVKKWVKFSYRDHNIILC